ncbi:hypothetical protein MKW94_018961, partial [Papaver nudicaule]|nr:hypothetical protein [Papaver nudicaule]
FFPLAMALVPGEDVDNWDWFLRNLYQIVDHEARPITFLTDRGEGLKQGIPSIFPGSFHSFCYYHLKTNLPINGTDPRYSLVLDHFQEATYVYTPENHTKAIQKIRDLGCDWVADYIEAIPADKYANAFFKGCRYGRTASSLAESFNAWITVHKKMPASAFLDQVRMKVMVMMFDNREVGALMKTPLTTLYEEKLQSLSDEGLAWPVNRASTTIYEVLSDESSHTVNLENRTCTCQRWRVYGFPCSHALAAMRKGRCDVHEYI